ncbi:MAG: HU family DNA-binding protein [Patescibacteria group bacterium]
MNISMNKAELINVIAEKVGVTKKQAEDMIEFLVETITEELKKGNEVTIAGFGQFLAKRRAGRMGVNPQNPTEKIQIPSVTVPKFKAGKGLKDALKASMAAAAPTAAPTM